ncbi:MAG: rhodanese-like domain-containing protein [Phycisphaerae bacterium]
MAKHAQRFLDVVNDAKRRIREVQIDEVKPRLDAGEDFFLVDVREDREYEAGHLPGALHIGKGVIERDIERLIPDLDAQIILYCGGGFRSALAADSLQKMGYTNVFSMDGGVRGWREAGHPIVRDEPTP